MPDDGIPPPAASAGPGAGHLDSWGEIAAYLHRSISTVQRWERYEGLPVHRIAHNKLGSVYARRVELDAWYEARDQGAKVQVTPAADSRIRLAVLPFQNLSGRSEEDYFSDGLTDELITHLARLRPDRLAVIARTSAVQYRNTAKDVRAIGAELGVGYVLEGSVRRGANYVRVSAQLVTTVDGSYLWAETYEEALAGFIAIQTAIARRVGDSLSIQLLSDQHAAPEQVRQTSPEALDEYLQGRYFWNMRSAEGFRRAMAYFERAIELDPEFARAHAGLADTYAVLGVWFYGVLSPKEAFPRARLSAQRALALDPGLAEAYATLGLLHYEFDWDWGAAERHFRRALELNPGYATNRQWYSLCLAAQGRSADGHAEIARARALDPLSPVLNQTAAFLHYFSREYERARDLCARILGTHPSLPFTHLLLAAVHCFMGRREDAFEEHDAFDRLTGGSAVSIMFRACHHAHFGERGLAERRLAELRQRGASGGVFSWHLALVHASLGDPDEAFAALEKAFDDRSDILAYLKAEPHWDPIRQDPRFACLLHRVGLD
jgi:TolB-like protein/Tfp pilus assembly protein PilF